MIELQSKVFAAFVAASLIVMFPSVITAFHVATVVSVRAHKNPSLDNLRFPHKLALAIVYLPLFLFLWSSASGYPIGEFLTLKEVIPFYLAGTTLLLLKLLPYVIPQIELLPVFWKGREEKRKLVQELYDIHDPGELKDIPTEKLLDYWDAITPRRIFEMPGCRAVLSYEFESRNPTGFYTWLRKENHTDEDLRQFMLGDQSGKSSEQSASLLMPGNSSDIEHGGRRGGHHRRESARSHRVRVSVRKSEKGK